MLNNYRHKLRVLRIRYIKLLLFLSAAGAGSEPALPHVRLKSGRFSELGPATHYF
jgi:hypothetical protein